jgi:hypothetical protein
MTYRADQILKRLINFVVRRGILVTAAQMSILIVYFVDPDGLYWTPVYFCTSKIYVITMSTSYLRTIARYSLILFVCLQYPCKRFVHAPHSCVLNTSHQAEWQRGHQTKGPHPYPAYNNSRLT